MKIYHPEITNSLFAIAIVIFLRCCVSLHSHSGQQKPPMYGDYEAQRHWMEITYNLPIADWYKNSSDNNLMYWGLDYPPLTAYHSYLCGWVANMINPKYVELFHSRGHESGPHKLFMRYTVLLTDVLLYVPAIFLYFFCVKSSETDVEDQSINVNVEGTVHGGTKKKRNKTKGANSREKEDYMVVYAIFLALIYPGLILIDHGHFQYNCVSLGFTVLAITCICKQYNMLGSSLFCLALNYKQMELYHSLPFFLYLLSDCIPKAGQPAIKGFIKLFKIGATVLVTFAVVWSPFLTSAESALQVLHRLFPVARGLFEDKVSNVWCALNVLYKFKTRFTNEEMFRYCTFTTLAAVIPSGADLFLRPNVKKFVLALINSSLGFFLFSFQVHEKSILLAALPVLLHMPRDPLAAFWFLKIATFSMLPLLAKDNLAAAYLATSLIYTVAFRHYWRRARHGGDGESQALVRKYYVQFVNLLVDVNRGKWDLSAAYRSIARHFARNSNVLRTLIVRASLAVSLTGCVVLTFVTLTFEPPEPYPDLFTLAVSVYSCAHFLAFFLYFNVQQFKVPTSFDFVKLKTA